MEKLERATDILNFMTVKTIHLNDYGVIDKDTEEKIKNLCSMFKNEMEDNYWNSDYLVVVMIKSLLLGVAVLSVKTESETDDADDDDVYKYMYLQYLCGKPGFGAGSIALVEAEKLASSLGMRYVELSSVASKHEYYLRRGYLPFIDSCSDNLELKPDAGSMTKCLETKKVDMTTEAFPSTLSDFYTSDEYSTVDQFIGDIKTKVVRVGSGTNTMKADILADKILPPSELDTAISMSDYYIRVFIKDGNGSTHVLGCALLKNIHDTANIHDIHDETIEEIQGLSGYGDITEEHGMFLVLMCGNTPKAIGSIILERIYNTFEKVNFIHTECYLEDVSSYIELGFRFPQTGENRDFPDRDDGLVHMMKEIKRSKKRKSRK